MRFGFVWKGAIVVALVVLFDRLFPDDFAGIGVGTFACAWLAGVVAGRPDVRKSRASWIAIGAALLFAVALLDDPGVLAWVLLWGALSMAALLPKVARFDDAWHWTARLALHAASAIVTPFRDLRLVRQGWRRGRGNPGSVSATLALPLVGGGLFVALFASANPLIAQAIAAIGVPPLGRAVLWALVALCIWPSLRPYPVVMPLASMLPDPEPRLPGTSLTSVLIALALFNALFAVQNALDIVFLWSGAALPAGMSQTDYVHRGAYPLIGTTLIAGVMALAMLRPGSASERHPVARRLVTLWVAQNMVLVASSALRTIDYVRASMLTEWRIAALAWMALVAIGLGLILWRILKGRSARWLVNRNALAALLVLTPCAFVDLGAVAAGWNVRAGPPERVDLCYLRHVGDGALLPLIELEGRPMDAATLDRVRYVRERLFADLTERQASWTQWTPRGARRLAQAFAETGSDRSLPVSAPAKRDCDGTVRYPAALTAGAQR